MLLMGRRKGDLYLVFAFVFAASTRKFAQVFFQLGRTQKQTLVYVLDALRVPQASKRSRGQYVCSPEAAVITQKHICICVCICAYV